MGWQDDPVIPTATDKPAWESDPVIKSGDSGKKPDVSGLEAFGRGAAQAFGLGYSPQLIAAAKTASLPGSEDPAYLSELKKQKAATEQAWEQHPWLYGGGMAASAIPAAAGAILGAPEAAAAGTIGSLGGAGLRALAGEGAGMLPSALRGAATVAENPVVQGAIFGSSEGENIVDKATGAAAGAVGAKVAPAVLGAVGSGIKAVGQKIAPDIVDPIFHALTGNPSTAKTAANIASEIPNVTLPAAAVSESGVLRTAIGADVFNQVPKAANKTLGEIGSAVSDYAANANRNDAGEAIRNAVKAWSYDSTNPAGFKTLMEQVYTPVRTLEASNAVQYPTSLQRAINAELRAPKGRMQDISSTLNIAKIPLATADDVGGLTFAEMKAFREILSDQISWNQAPGVSGINNDILKRLRDSVTQDMAKYAKNVGGKKMMNDFINVNKKASDLYNLRNSIYNLTGNPEIQGAGAYANDAIYSKIIGAAAKRGGADISDLDKLYNTVIKYDPKAWQSIGQAYAADRIAPNGQFTFANFHKHFDDFLDPRGKALIFGQPSEKTRQMFENISALGRVDARGQPLGKTLDSFAAKVGISPIQQKVGAAELASGFLEHQLTGGVPIGTIGAGAIGAGAGSLGARNVAAPMSQYAPSKAAQIAGETVKRAAPLIGAQEAEESPLPGAIKAAVPVGIHQITKQLPPWLYSSPGSSSSGIRYGRKHGGRVSDKLVAAVDRAKKNINNSTQSLLRTPDTHVAQALEIANRNLEGTE
jgi:hypothetical protein